MKISEIMKKNVVSVHLDASLSEAVSKLVDNHVGLLPVVDNSGLLSGVISLRDILRLYWPSFMSLVEDYDFVHDFGALEKAEIPPDVQDTPVSEIMQEPLMVEGTSKLLRAAAFMRQHDIRDLPVVDEAGRLIGLASWVDVGTAFLRDQRDQNLG